MAFTSPPLDHVSTFAGIDCHILTWRDLPARWKGMLINSSDKTGPKSRLRIETWMNCERDEKMVSFIWTDPRGGKHRFDVTAREAIADNDDKFNTLSVRLRVSPC